MVTYRKRNSFKLIIICLALALGGVSLFTRHRVQANVSGPPLGYTGAPTELNCTTSSCHTTFGLNSGPGTVELTGLPANYTGGQEYTLTLTVKQSSRGAFGFELTVLDTTNNKAGTLATTATDATRTQVRTNFNGRQYILHQFNGTEPVNGEGKWTFKWTAPATSTGKVTFYVAANAASGDGTQLGDYIYTRSFALDPQVALTATTVSAANYSATPGVTAEGIAAVFGSKLATVTSAVFGDDSDPITPGVQLPTTLGGTTIRVKDSAGNERFAPLFFVVNTQINFQIPQGTAAGAATVTVTASDGTISTGTVNVVAVAPALFAASSTGGGPAAALVLRIKADNSQIYESVATFDGAKFVTSPISLGPDTDQLFLILFGTGIRGNTNLANASATIGGLNSQVDFAGAQGGFVGLDQANTRIPRNVTLNQDLDIVLTLSGISSNKVTISFKQ